MAPGRRSARVRPLRAIGGSGRGSNLWPEARGHRWRQMSHRRASSFDRCRAWSRKASTFIGRCVCVWETQDTWRWQLSRLDEAVADGDEMRTGQPIKRGLGCAAYCNSRCKSAKVCKFHSSSSVSLKSSEKDELRKSLTCLSSHG